ncbi:MAG: phage tail length tape measure family protein, partial [Zavarzinia sp.]|nr:phage tail length tape measure family protein [Zavarzinia sp.]
MTDLTLRLRITTDGFGATTAEVVGLGNAAQTMGTAVSAAGARAGQALTGVGAAARGAGDDITASAARISTAWDGVIAGAGQMAAATELVRGKYVPLAAAESAHAAALVEIRQAQQAGILTAQEATTAIASQTAALDRQRAVMSGARSGLSGWAATGKLASYEASNLAYQLNDVVVSIVGGLNPAMVALQQGPQISAIFGGWGNTARALLQWLSPVKVGLLGIAGVAITGASAWNSYLTSIKAVEVAAAGIGRASGATAAQLEEIAQAAASAGDISIKSAREMEVTLLRTGRIGADMFGDLIGMSRDFGATIGTDAAAGLDQLAKLIADPAKGAETLYREMELLDGATARYVKTLVDQGRVERAQQVLMEGARGRLVSARAAVTELGSAWDRLGTVIDNVMDLLGQGVDAVFSSATNADPVKALSSVEAQIKSISESGIGYRPVMWRELLGELERERERLKKEVEYREGMAFVDNLTRQYETDARRADAALALADTSPSTENARRLTSLRNEQQALEGQSKALSLNADERARVATAYEAITHAVDSWMPAQERATALIEADLAAARAITPEQKRQAAMDRERLALRGEIITSAEAEARVTAAGRRAYEEATLAIGRQTQALSVNAATALTAADAYLTSSAAGMVAEARRAATIDSLKSGIDAGAQAQRLLAEQVAGAALSGAQQVAQLRDQTEAQRLVNDAVVAGTIPTTEAAKALEIEQALRPLVTAAANAEGAEKAKLVEITEALRAAMVAANDETERGQAIAGAADQRQALELAQYELSLVDETTERREYLVALREKEIDLAARYGENWREIAGIEYELYAQTLRTNAAIAARTQQSELIAGAYRRAGEEIQDSLSSGLRDALDGGRLDAEAFWDDFKSIALDAIAEITAALVFKPIVGGFVNAAFGGGAASALGLSSGDVTGQGSGGSITDLLGLSNLFGGSGSSAGWLAGANGYLFGTAGSSAAATTGAASGFLTGGGAASSGAAGSAGLFGTYGATSLGSILGAGGAGFGISQLLAGLAPGNKLVSAGGGALGGALAGAAIGGPIGAVIGGVTGLIGGLLNDKPSNMLGASTIADLSASTAGVDSGQYGSKYSAENHQAAALAADAIRDAAQAAFGSYVDLSAYGVQVAVGSRDGANAHVTDGGIDSAVFVAAGDEPGIKSLIGQSVAAIGDLVAADLPEEMQRALDLIDWSDVDQAVADLDFAATYRDSVDALTAGYDLETEARQAVRDSLTTTIDGLRDFAATAERLTLGGADSAVRSYALRLIGLEDEAAAVSDTQAAIAALDEAFTVFRERAADLGVTLDEVSAGYAASFDRLRADFEGALDAAIGTGLGRGYLAEASALIDAQSARIADAAALGADMGRVFRFNALEMAALYRDLNETQIAALDDLIAAADDLSITAASLLGRVTSGAEALIDEAEDARKEAIRLGQTWAQVAASARDELGRLSLSDASILSPAEMLAEAESRFRETFGKALAGDTDAAAALSASAETYLAQARTYYADSQAYIGIFEDVQSAIEQVAVGADTRAAGYAALAATMDLQVDILAEIRDIIARSQDIASL